MTLRIVQIDAFTDRPFAGNPAAVCVLPEPRSAEWMASVAREMNLSVGTVKSLNSRGLAKLRIPAQRDAETGARR